MVIASDDPSADLVQLRDLGAAEVHEAPYFTSLIRSLQHWPDQPAGPGDAFPAHVLAITAPVVLSPGLLEQSLPALDDDLRIATISFFSNNAGYLSVPHRNRQTHHQIGSHDETTINRALRTIEPHDGLVSVPFPAGAVHLLSRHALSACDGLRDGLRLTANGLVADLALRAQRRGFVSAVDTSGFVLSPWDLGAAQPDPMENLHERNELVRLHPFAAASYAEARDTETSPTALVVRSAAAKISGLRVAIDGTCLGDKEMGTQVQTLALAKALAERDDVQRVTIVTNGPIPAYAGATFAARKVVHIRTNDSDFSHIDEVDVLHRPYQPDSSLPYDDWRKSAHRVVITLQDLIAYQVGAYSETGESWMRYRHALQAGAARADGVVVISHDTGRQLGFERLAVARDRVFVVPNGTDHLTGSEAAQIPSELTSRGFLSERFLVVLGANYGHKNRDLAVGTWKLLRNTFPDLALVLAGAAVPFGSTRVAESIVASQTDEGLYVLPDVSSQERNWLLRHAEVVLYPTSAEGFGLVPFEAARFGTPTVNVGFGPLTEVNPSVEPSPATWSPQDFAAAAGAMLEDPTARAAKVAATLKAGTDYTWAATAAGLVHCYRTILSQPPNLVG
jgi:glycosyltransferase involved in cell wall biosynthesis